MGRRNSPRDETPSLVDAVRTHSSTVAAFFEPALPYATQAAASALAFTAGLVATQATCFALRISCATPLLAPAAGALGVGVSSALAGQASLRARRNLRSDESAGTPLPRLWRRADVLCDAALGVVLFRAMGGRFRSLLPSDLVKPGACAVESLPAPGSQYASDVCKGELARLMRRDGCHHCGRKHGRVIGDHIPPNKVAYGSRALYSGGSYPANGGVNPWTSPSSSSSSASSSSSSSSAAALANAASQFITTAARSQPRGGGYGIGGGGGGLFGGGSSRNSATAADIVGGIVGGSLRLLWTAGSAAVRAAAAGSAPKRRPHRGSGGGLRLGRSARAWVARQRVMTQWRLKEAMGLNPPRQRYFPQCRPCSQLQAAAVRTGKRTLKTHAGGSKPWFYSGVMVGCRHYQEPGLFGASGGGRGGGGSGGRLARGGGTSGFYSSSSSSFPLTGGISRPDDDVLEDLASAVRNVQEGVLKSTFGKK